MGLVLAGSIAHRCGMSNAEWTIDVGDADFEHEVLEHSQETPVVVDFWAPWCAPCGVLGPILERLATEHRGAFRLAKLNVDVAPETAQRFEIRSIPAVLGFREGKPVAEFLGAQPESVVRQFLEALLPTEADRLVREGRSLALAEDPMGAEARFREALEREAFHPGAALGLAKLLAARGESQEALDLLESSAPAGSLAEEAERLAAELRTRAGASQDLAALRRRTSELPDDLSARLELGRALAAQKSYAEALSELLEVVDRDPDFQEEAARKAMLDIFALLGPEDPLTLEFRGRLAKTLFR
jgi:putative thioredoxin